MRTKRKILAVLKYVAVFLVFLCTVLPIFWMFVCSISKTKYLISMDSPILPLEITFERYESIFAVRTSELGVKTAGEVFRIATKNSLIVAVLTTAISLAVGTLAAYAFARLRFKKKDALLSFSLFAQMLPAIALIIPMFFIFKKLEMNDRLITLVLVYISFVLPYVIWVLNGYFKTIPKDLEDAARIDGCSRLRAFVQVVVPISGPGFVAVGVLAFLMSWDEFMYSLLLITSQTNKTIPVAISEFSSQFGVDYGMMMTGGCIATVIPLALALIFQKWISMGLTSGAVKE
ncbi:MAG: carbohydrate ABC transporter permease [Lachnospiraceae bacterium]